VVPDLILQSAPGDLFVLRNAGNIIPPWGEPSGVTATIEYAVDVLKVTSIVVCGHSDCGAMKALLHPESTDSLVAVSGWLRHAEAARRVVTDHYPDHDEHTIANALVEENVLAQIEHLETHPSVSSRVQRGDLEIYGWVYRIETGEIVALDAEQGRFVPLDESLPTATQKRRRILP